MVILLPPPPKHTHTHGIFLIIRHYIHEQKKMHSNAHACSRARDVRR